MAMELLVTSYPLNAIITADAEKLPERRLPEYFQEQSVFSH